MQCARLPPRSRRTHTLSAGSVCKPRPASQEKADTVRLPQKLSRKLGASLGSLTTDLCLADSYVQDLLRLGGELLWYLQSSFVSRLRHAVVSAQTKSGTLRAGRGAQMAPSLLRCSAWRALSGTRRSSTRPHSSPVPPTAQRTRLDASCSTLYKIREGAWTAC